MVKGSVEQIGLDQGKVYAKSHTVLRAISPLVEGIDPIFNQITTLARNIANLMINEMSDWKVVYQDRPPTLPA
jgi:hypothetical protein